MTQTIALSDFQSSVLEILKETFEKVEGNYLDGGTSLFETLEGVPAETASRSASDRVATLAAQVDHTGYYIEVLLAHLRAGGQDTSFTSDWDAAWNRTTVTAEEWPGLIAALRDQYEQFQAFVSTNENWNADVIGGVLAVLSHCAYHLGEIRQALGVIPQ
jgi:hypothetical protein